VANASTNDAETRVCRGFIAVSMQIIVIWDVTPCSLVDITNVSELSTAFIFMLVG
jgi:hypothetical protein